jgi:inhibitor of cysteine peptidase
MLRPVLAVAFAALVAACATPPMPREINEAAEGARVTLARGQELIVTLDGNQTTGFRWSLARAAPELVQIGEATYVARATEGRQAGSGGLTTFRFRAETAGTSSLGFAYRRPWEANIPPAKSIRFEVRVE